MPYQSSDSTCPIIKASAVTPSDATELVLTRGLWVGVGGNVAITDSYGTNTTYAGVPSGYLLPVQCTKVRATGTTASSILALY